MRISGLASSTKQADCGIPCNGIVRPMVIDKIQPNRTNRIKLGCLIVILPVHGLLADRTLPLHGIETSPEYSDHSLLQHPDKFKMLSAEIVVSKPNPAYPTTLLF